MLRAPQSFVFPEFTPHSSGIHRPSRHSLPFLRRNPPANAYRSGDRNRRNGRRRMGLAVEAAYRRVPMENSDAYQLINEDTGEKVIVWGDAGDSPIPSEEALSWKPNRRLARKERSKNEVFDAAGAKGSASAAVADSQSMAHLSASVCSFGRLKVHRIRSSVKKSSEVPAEDASSNTEKKDSDMNVETSIQKASSDESDCIDSVQFLGARATSVLFKHPELKNETITNEIAEGTDFSDVIPKSRTPDASLSVPRLAYTYRESNATGVVKSTSTTRLNKLYKKHADSGFFSRKSFKDLGCTDDIIESLRSQMYLRPSNIQAMAYKTVLEGKSCVVADQSGSGKTLAYLAPIIQRLRQEELLGLGKSLSGSPRVVILVPTAELASQVLQNCRSIARFGVPFRSMVATGGFRQKTQLDSLQQQLDVLIATPGRFIFLLQEGVLHLSNLKSVVLDEVDILFGDEGFEQVLQTLISSAPMITQYLFVTATLPVDIYNKLVEVFPDCEVTMGPGMHRTSSGLEEILVDCSGDDRQEKNLDTAFMNKKTSLLQLVKESPVPKTIIFCNKIETCRKVENVLKRFDRNEFRIKTLPFHAAVTQEIRLSNMKEFLSSQSKDSMFLICTDRASRGIDFTNVDHVILFDFPRDPSEYVRRVGRTARGAGGEGKAFIFVVGKQVSMARRILERNKKGHPLHDVPSAYEMEGSIF